MCPIKTRIQDLFTNALRRSKTPVTMFLVKGVKLQGIITGSTFSASVPPRRPVAARVQARDLDDHAVA